MLFSFVPAPSFIPVEDEVTGKMIHVIAMELGNANVMDCFETSKDGYRSKLAVNQQMQLIDDMPTGKRQDLVAAATR